MKITLLIPTVNELEAMRIIMPRIKDWWVDQILFVDGYSTDGTVEYIREHGYELFQQKKLGLRNAFTEALPYIKGDIIITFSPDGNSIPELIPKLMDKMQDGYDMVIVSRYKDGAVSLDDDNVTAFGNWFFRKTINLLHRGHYTDPMVMFRAFKKSLIYELRLNEDDSFQPEERIFRTNVSWEPLMSIRCAKRRRPIAEISGDEPMRIGGKRKLKIIQWGCAYLWEVLKEVKR